MKDWKISFLNNKEPLSLPRTNKQIKGQIYSIKFLKNKNQKRRTKKILKTSKNQEKMSVRVNVRMSKIMLTPIKVGVRTHATYASCWTLNYILRIFYKK